MFDNNPSKSHCMICGATENLIPVRYDIEEYIEEIGETFYHGWEAREVCPSCFKDGDYDVVVFDEYGYPVCD